MKKRLKHVKYLTTIHLLILLVLILGGSIYVTAVNPLHSDAVQNGANRSVVLDVESYNAVKENYNNSVENGFCIYGNVTSTSFQIREIDLVENPSKQSYGKVKFSCRSSMIENIEKLLLESDFSFIGTIHTHPEESESMLSFHDVRNLGIEQEPLKGVYNGETLNFYNFEEPDQPLTIFYTTREEKIGKNGSGVDQGLTLTR